MPVGTGVSSTVVSANWLIANVSGDTLLPLTKIADGASAIASSNVQPGYYGVSQLSFATPSQGWVLLRNGRLLATTDGGSNWSQLVFGWGGQAPASQPLSSPLSTGVGGSKNYVQRAGRRSMSIESIQLLAPGVGIAVTRGNGLSKIGRPQLLRTEDGGSHWREITPHFADSDKIVSSFFFLDSQHGWTVSWHWAQVPPSWFSRWGYGDKSAKPEFEPAFDLIYTADGGVTWSSTQIGISEIESLRDTIQPTAQIGFVDPGHGWMILTISDPATSAFNWDRKLLITTDGGRKWRPMPDAPVKPAAVSFVTPARGWMVGDPQAPAGNATTTATAPRNDLASRPNDMIRKMFPKLRGVPIRFAQRAGHRPLPAGSELYSTSDGAKSWQKVSIEIPKEVYSAELAKNPPPNSRCIENQLPGEVLNNAYPPPTAIYNLPTFTDSRHGFLPVTYQGESGINCKQKNYHAVLFATDDGGKTWKPDRMMISTLVYGMPMPAATTFPRCTTCTLQSAVVGSTWLLAPYSEFGPPSRFITLKSGTTFDASNETYTAFWSIDSDADLSFDFTTPSNGWLAWHQQLLSTTDTGGTWTPIGPKSDESLLDN
jgi:photosystem II stability/assembly factor-like uncharacterized protein